MIGLVYSFIFLEMKIVMDYACQRELKLKLIDVFYALSVGVGQGVIYYKFSKN